jgi:hypothetical protein
MPESRLKKTREAYDEATLSLSSVQRELSEVYQQDTPGLHFCECCGFVGCRCDQDADAD